MPTRVNTNQDNGVYYFLGNTTSHILHALPLYEKLGGTFVVLSNKAKRRLEQYNVSVIAVDDRPYKLTRFGWRIKPIHEYSRVTKACSKTVEFLNTNAKVVLFYDLFDFEAGHQITKPTTFFLTHGNMLKDYMGQNNRLEILNQYDYMAAIGPRLKNELIQSGVDPKKLLDLGLARTDELVNINGLTFPVSDKLGLPIATEGRLIFSYLPTFWGASSVQDIGLELIANFPEKYVLIFRPHPQTPKRITKKYLDAIKTKNNIIFAPEGLYPELDLIKIFRVSSAIIGDLSSVMLEAILLKKPLIFMSATRTAKGFKNVEDVVNNSQTINVTNISNLDSILNVVTKQKVDEKIWKRTIDINFYHARGDSVAAIINVIENKQ